MIVVDYGNPRLGVDLQCKKEDCKKVTALELVKNERLFTLDKKARKPNTNSYKLVIKTHFSFKLMGVEEIASIKLTGTYDVTFSSVANNESPDDIEKLIVCIQTMFNTTYEAFRKDMKGTIFERLATISISREEIIESLKLINIRAVNPISNPDLN